MDAAREIDIILNFLADTAEARQMNKEMQNIVNTSKEAAKGAGRMGQYYSDGYAQWRYKQKLLSEESRAMQREMSYGWMRNSEAYKRAVNDMVAVRYGFYKMAKAGKDYEGTNVQMMNQIYELGAAQKKINDNMIKENVQLRQSFLQTAGTMSAMTTQASKISANYQRMKNPLYMVNMGHLALADSLNKVANNGNAANLALRMLGKDANTKELNDMVMMINQGIVRFQFVAIGAAITSLLLYAGMHKLAMSNERYANSLNAMGKAILQAIQPALTVFIDLTTALFGFITRVANAITVWNEANPVLARFVQGILLLAPALTLLLSPLAIGIGYFGGLQAALFALWAFIGPMVTGLAAMTGTVWVLGAALVALYMYFLGTGDAAEAFRTKVDETISDVIAKIQELLQFAQPALNAFGEAFKNAFSTVSNAIKGALAGDFTGLQNIFSSILPSLIGLLVGGIPGLIISMSRFFPALAQGLESGTGSITTVIQNVVKNIVNMITNGLPLVVQAGVQIITQLIQGIASSLPSIATGAVYIMMSLIESLKILLPLLLESALTIVQALAEGIIAALPALSTTVMQLLLFIMQSIIDLLPMLLNTGMEILLTLINGIVLMLPQLITLIIDLVVQILNTIVIMLPQILAMGVNILLQLLAGIISALPDLIGGITIVILTLLGTLVNALPDILSAGMQILATLINGILSAIENVSNAAWNIITTFANKITSYDYASIGKNIINGIISGLTEAAKWLYDTAVGIAETVAGKFKSFFGIASPSKLFTEYGEFITQGAAIGMVNEVPKINQATRVVSGSIVDGFSNDTAGADYSTTSNNSSVTNSPTVQIYVDGKSAGSDYDGVKNQVNDAMKDFFDYFKVAYGG